MDFGRPSRLWTPSLLALLVCLAGAGSASALDFGGFARIFWTDTASDTSSGQTLDTQLRLGLRQELTPYLSLDLTFSHLEISTETGVGQEAFRRLQEPQIGLLYSRPNVTARLGYNYRRANGTFDPENFESRGLVGTLFWRAKPYLTFDFGYREDINETDVAALGRNTASRTYRGSARLQRSLWSGTYQYSRNELENRETGLSSDQDRHDLRLETGGSFFRNKLSVSAQGQAGRLDRRQEVPQDAQLADPVPAAQGLFAVELNPTIGDLEPSPGLIDGDFQTPVTPPIQIGGAATFRNLGLDLGITRPISRLEVTVDRPSDPRLIWEVYQSRDNLFWQPVDGILTEWDGALLSYTVRFPEVTDRYFKIVNVSTNAAAEVLVTELRALRDLTGVSGTEEARTDLYRLDLSAGYQFSQRARLALGAGTRNDEATVAGLVRQDRTVDYANAGFEFLLARDLELNLNYAWNDTVDGRDPELDRTTETIRANLLWLPLPTVRMIATAGTYEERQRGNEIQSGRSALLGAGLQLLPALRLDTNIRYSLLEDPFAGFDRDTWSFNINLQAQMRRNWALRGGYNRRSTETAEGEPLLTTSGINLWTSWSPGTLIRLTGEWRYTMSSTFDTFRQTYGIFYNPGPKLSMGLSWNHYDSDSGRTTAYGNASVSYRLYRRVLIWASANRSRAGQDGAAESEIRSVQLGLTIEF